MSKADTLKLGDWNAICDRCGFKFKASELKKTWDNLYVCEDDWEPRHPMDFLRGRPDDSSTPWNRLDGADSAGVDIEGNSTDFIGNTVDVGDVNKTLTVGTDATVQNWSTALSTDRTVTLSTVGADAGDTFQIYRTSGGAGQLIIGAVKTVPANINAVAVVRYNGGAWVLDSYTTLGL